MSIQLKPDEGILFSLLMIISHPKKFSVKVSNVLVYEKKLLKATELELPAPVR